MREGGEGKQYHGWANATGCHYVSMQDGKPYVAAASYLCACAAPWTLAWRHYLGWSGVDCAGGRFVGSYDPNGMFVLSSPCRVYADGANWLGNRDG